MSILGPLALYSLTLGADVYSTDRALRNPYVTEGNQLMRDRTVMLASHVASAAALTWIDTRLQKRSKVAPWILRGAVIVGGAYVTRRNLDNARRVR